MNDLDQLLHGARDAIADATGPIDERTLTRVRGTVRRARIRRHAVESVGTAAFVGALGVGAWYAAGQGDATPVPPAETSTASPTSNASASPSPTSTPSPTPTPTPSATPTVPAERAAEIDDATIMERLLAPRTGETWTDPVLDDEAEQQLLAASAREDWSVYRVGTRGSATIYVALEDSTVARASLNESQATLFEVDDAGARLVTCPSARTGDLCVDDVDTGKPFSPAAEGVTLDPETFYDTLTLPSRIAAGGTWTFSTDATRADPYPGVYGSPRGFAEPDRHRVLADLGPLALVLRSDTTGGVDGLESFTYAVRLPFGSFVTLWQEDLPNAKFDTITWDDGIRRTNESGDRALAPGTFVCIGSYVSLEPEHDPTQWREAGTTAEGERVIVPAAGGTELSRAVRAYQEEQSSGSENYLYPDDASFLEAHALWGVQGPDGAWNLHLRSDGGSFVFDCE